MKISQTVAFSERLEFKTLLEVESKSASGLLPAIYQKADEFISMISLLDTIDVLILDSPEDPATFNLLLKEVKSRIDQIKRLYVLTDDKRLIGNATIFEKNKVELLFNELKNLMTPLPDANEGYISIPIDSLIHFKVLPFDLYIKISDSKYLKRIPAHEGIDGSTFASFMSNGVTDLYFERKHNRDFSMMLINNMINRVDQEYSSLDEKLVATNDVFLTTQQIVDKLGFKPRVVEVCESVLNQITEDVSSGKDNFSKFLKQLRTQTDLSFHYRFMELTSFIAIQIVDVMEINNKRDCIPKIVFASMFCDYTLKTAGHIHIRSTEQQKKIRLVEQKITNEHALQASELASKYQNAPYDAIMIIKQHHGSLTGVGFPKEISPNLLPFSKCLMTAQEIAYQILMESDRHPIDVLSDIKLKFIDTPLEDLFVLFENTCLENLRG